MQIPASLTSAELSAAKAFRDAQHAILLKKDKTDIIVSVLIHHYRHDCVKQGGKSVSLELREHYVLSPELWVCYCGSVSQKNPEVFPHRDCDGGRVAAEAGRFGWIFTEGHCPACGVTARSGTGRLVDTAVRPPGPSAVPG